MAKQFVLSGNDRNLVQDLLRPKTDSQRYRRRNEIPPTLEIVQFKNTTTTKFEPFSFVKLAEFNIAQGYYDAELPDSEELGLTPLSAGQLAITLSAVEPEKKGVGHLAIIRAKKVEIDSDAENIEVGDPVGSKDGSGKAILGGPFRALAIETENEGKENEKEFAWVRRDD